MMKLSSSKANMLNMRSSLARELEAQYKAHTGTGRDNELRVANTIRSLFDVSDAWVAAPGSILDTAYKVDIVCELPDLDVSLCLQVKTTREQRDAYYAQYKDGVPVEGRLYSAADCIVAASNLSIVKQLFNTELAAYAKDGLLEALDLMVKVKGKSLPTAVIQPKTKFFLLKLGVTQKGNNLVFPK